MFRIVLPQLHSGARSWALFQHIASRPGVQRQYRTTTRKSPRLRAAVYRVKSTPSNIISGILNSNEFKRRIRMAADKEVKNALDRRRPEKRKPTWDEWLLKERNDVLARSIMLDSWLVRLGARPDSTADECKKIVAEYFASNENPPDQMRYPDFPENEEEYMLWIRIFKEHEMPTGPENVFRRWIITGAMGWERWNELKDIYRSEFSDGKGENTLQCEIARAMVQDFGSLDSDAVDGRWVELADTSFSKSSMDD